MSRLVCLEGKDAPVLSSNAGLSNRAQGPPCILLEAAQRQASW